MQVNSIYESSDDSSESKRLHDYEQYFITLNDRLNNYTLSIRCFSESDI